jgi:ketosteroid isomerase-like protein
MHRSLLAGLIAVFAVVTIRAQAPSAVERDLIKLENDWSTAWQKKDAAFLQKLFADEYLSTASTGAIYSKAQELANVTAPGTSMASFALTDLKVHVYGDTAVVTGLNTTKSTFNGKDDSGAYRFTDVFVKRDGRWQVVATQSTLTAKK